MESLSKKYHFNDFTQDHYSELLQLARKNWKIETHATFDKDDTGFILWRHDVDFSMHIARDLSRLEAKAGIKSTYFVLLHSEYYSLFEREITDLVREIIDNGHDIALHFDSHYYDIKEAQELDKYLSREKQWLEDVFSQEIKSFSFHNNTDFTMSCEDWKYAGLLNCYATYFKKEIGYCSDSHGIWRFRRLHDVLANPVDKRLQVLTHPEWWQIQATSPRKRIQRCIDGRAAKQLKLYDDFLHRTGRPNIDE